MKDNAILIINLGTPNSSTPKDVGIYLKEFLTDPYVISLPWFLRYPLVHGLIVPTRKHNSAANYQKIWSKEKGSPLLSNTLELVESYRQVYGDQFDIHYAMRYGNPSIKETLKKMENYKSIYVFYLYPQYTQSSYITAFEKVEQEAYKIGIKDKVIPLPTFHNEDFYIDAIVDKINQFEIPEDSHFLFSYHGIPQSHLPNCSFKDNQCLEGAPKKNCYRAQCFETTTLIAAKLSLPQDRYTTSFQSRLGRQEWIKPYTDKLLPVLAKKDFKTLIVLSPSFITDCLETLEEIKMGYQEEFKSYCSDKEFIYIPCINNSQKFVQNWGKWTNSLDLGPTL